MEDCNKINNPDFDLSQNVMSRVLNENKISLRKAAADIISSKEMHTGENYSFPLEDTKNDVVIICYGIQNTAIVIARRAPINVQIESEEMPLLRVPKKTVRAKASM